LILAYWRKKLFNKSQKELNKYNKAKIEFISDDRKGVICKLGNCDSIELKGLTKCDLKVINDAQNRIINSIIKQNCPLRLGILWGLFLEVENICHSDSLDTQDGKMFFQHNFVTTSKFRWELRPTLDFKLSDGIGFKIRPYIKLPMPWEWKVYREGEKFTDSRLDFPINMYIELNDKFEIEFNYMFYYDNAPNSILLEGLTPESSLLYLTANKVHHYFNFQVSYQFK